MTAETLVANRMELVRKEAVQIQSSAKAFAGAAGQGFHIDPQAAATLINACRDALDQLLETRFEITTVSQVPKLGQTPGANVVGPFTQNAATDNDGIRSAITNLENTLRDMIQAYQKASTNYAQTEELVQQAMRSEQAKLPSAVHAPVLET
ncbi:MAG TPA: hypothetical protein VHF06_11840 [Pseudonocardiaceae bacterium]|nr:hypothetical protein [Pseudonocardiaceae bacterium]